MDGPDHGRCGPVHQPCCRDSSNVPGFDRHERLAGADIDLLDSHKPIMAAAAGLANPITGQQVAAADSTEAIGSPAQAALREQ